MDHRALMAKFDPRWVVIPGTGHCACGQDFDADETVVLYPIPDMDAGYRDIVCLTCHFWFTHNVLSELDS